MRLLSICLICVMLSGNAIAQHSVSLDSGFGVNGILKPDSLSVIGPTQMALQPDGRIITAFTYNDGVYNIAIRRLMPDGRPDLSFNDSGWMSIPIPKLSTLVSIGLQKNGKILALVSTGYYQGNAAQLFRLHPDGHPDSTLFALNVYHSIPTTITIFGTMIVDTKDRIWLCGGGGGAFPTGPNLDIQCFTADGRSDSSLGKAGAQLRPKAWFSPYDMEVLPDNKLLIAGYKPPKGPDATTYWAVARYFDNGNIDSSFNHIGFCPIYLLPDESVETSSIAQTPSGAYIIAGWTYHGGNMIYCRLAEIRADGTYDSAWAANSGVYIDSLNSEDLYLTPPHPAVKVQPDGKIVVTFGAANEDGHGQFALYRFFANGLRDDGFGAHGKLTISLSTEESKAEHIEIQPDGKILVSGKWTSNSMKRLGLVRYISTPAKANGQTADCSSANVVLSPNPVVKAARIEYSLSKEGQVALDAFSIDGRLTAKLLPVAYRWQGINADQIEVPDSWPTGVYVLRLIVNDKVCNVRFLKK